MSGIFRRSVIFSATTLIGRAINLCTLSVILAMVGRETFGAFQYHVSILSVAVTIGALGTNALLFREFCQTFRNASSWLYHGIIVRSGGTLISLAGACLVVSVAKLPIDPWLFIACAILGVGEATVQLYSAWLRARNRPVVDLIVTSARGALVLLSVAVALQALPDSRGIAIGYVCGVAVVLLWCVGSWLRPLRIGRRQSFNYPALVGPAFTIFLCEVMGALYTELPVLFLGRDGAFDEVGRYATYFKFLSPAVFVVMSYGQSFHREFSRAARSRDGAQRGLFRRGAKTMLLLSIASAAGVFTFGPFLLHFAAHQPKTDWQLMSLYALLPFGVGFAGMFENGLMALRRERPIIVSHGAGLLALAILIFWLPVADPALRGASALLAAYGFRAVMAGFLFWRSI